MLIQHVLFFNDVVFKREDYNPGNVFSLDLFEYFYAIALNRAFAQIDLISYLLSCLLLADHLYDGFFAIIQYNFWLAKGAEFTTHNHSSQS